MAKNRREFFRVTFLEPLDGRVQKWGEAPVPIDINDLSVTGMGFTSPDYLAMKERVDCMFEVMDTPFHLEGFIIRSASGRYGTDYGMQFIIDPETSKLLFQQLNFHEIRRRKGR